MKRLVGLRGAAGGRHACGAEPVGAALDRPAQTVRAPERAVLLAAARRRRAGSRSASAASSCARDDGGAPLARRWPRR